LQAETASYAGRDPGILFIGRDAYYSRYARFWFGILGTPVAQEAALNTSIAGQPQREAR
jgi:hypothetical protein